MSIIEELNNAVCTLHNCNQDWFILNGLHTIFKICCWISWLILSCADALNEPRNSSLGYFDTVWWIAVYALFYGMIMICIYSLVTFFMDEQKKKLEAQIQYQAKKACGFSLNLTRFEIKKNELTKHLFLKLVIEIEITNPPVLRDNIDFLIYISRMQHLYQTEVLH
jgi:hypothetical protein